MEKSNTSDKNKNFQKIPKEIKKKDKEKFLKTFDYLRCELILSLVCHIVSFFFIPLYACIILTLATIVGIIICSKCNKEAGYSCFIISFILMSSIFVYNISAFVLGVIMLIHSKKYIDYFE